MFNNHIEALNARDDMALKEAETPKAKTPEVGKVPEMNQLWDEFEKTLTIDNKKDRLENEEEHTKPLIDGPNISQNGRNKSFNDLIKAAVEELKETEPSVKLNQIFEKAGEIKATNALDNNSIQEAVTDKEGLGDPVEAQKDNGDDNTDNNRQVDQNTSEQNENAENIGNSELTIEEKQEIADQAARDYNDKTHPYERAVEKGIDGVQQTENGGVSFAETDKVYTTEDGRKCVVKIKATGSRQKDFDEANKEMGLTEVPEGYVWHHVDDYNVEDGTVTLELVEDSAHNATKPHSGGCAQYDAVNGPSYNPPRKGEQ